VTVAPSDFKEPPRYRASLAEWEWFRTWFSSQGLLCWVCSSAPWTELHHLLARSHGGDDDITNLVPVCAPCHRRIEERDMEARRLVRWALLPSNYEYLQGKLHEQAEGWLERNYPREEAA
jgi:5-methylcytosine-specific restriction endonuclease McrA